MEENNKVTFKRYSNLTLGEAIEVDGVSSRATLTWSVRNGYPRAVVYTDSNKAFQSGKPDYNFIITVPFDLMNLGMVISVLEDIDKGPNDDLRVINSYNTKVENGERTNTRYLQGKLVIGKDKDGVRYIAAIEDGKKKVKFRLLPNMRWIQYANKDGSEITDMGKLSGMFTKNYIYAMKKVLLARDNFNINVETIDAPKRISPQQTNNQQPVKVEPKVETSTVEVIEGDDVEDMFS